LTRTQKIHRKGAIICNFKENPGEKNMHYRMLSVASELNNSVEASEIDITVGSSVNCLLISKMHGNWNKYHGNNNLFL